MLDSYSGISALMALVAIALSLLGFALLFKARYALAVWIFAVAGLLHGFNLLTD